MRRVWMVAGLALGLAGSVAEASPAPLAIVTLAEPSHRYVAPGQHVRLVLGVLGGHGRPAFAWHASSGRLLGPGAREVVWVAPRQRGDAMVEVVARDGVDEAPGAYRFTVR